MPVLVILFIGNIRFVESLQAHLLEQQIQTIRVTVE